MDDLDIKKFEKLINDGLTLKEVSIEMKTSISSIKRKMIKYDLKSKFYSNKKESVLCLNCKNNFESLITEKRKFCSSSCSSIYNNQLRTKKEIKREYKKRYRIFKERKIGICLNCKKDIIKKDGRSKAKYCDSKCQSEFRMNERITNNKASSKTLKLFLIRKYGNKCMLCGWCKINKYSGRVPIELEHIDGNSENNKLENLKLLCPNCHSLTPTYKALNKGKGRHKRMERYNEGKSY